MSGSARSLLLSTWAVALAATATAGGCAHSRVLIHGTVVDSVTRTPLAGAAILIDGKQRRAADSLGRYLARGVRSGPHSVSATAKRHYPAITRITVAPLDTVRHDFILAPSPRSTFFLSRGEVWLGCAGALHADGCDHGRRLEPSLGAFPTAGTWVIDDAAQFDRFARAHASGSPRTPSPPIDWSVEHLVVATGGGRSGCGDAHLINRLERRHDSTFVVIGPDSLPDGPSGDICAAYRADADAVVARRSGGPVVFVPARRHQSMPPSGIIPP